MATSLGVGSAGAASLRSRAASRVGTGVPFPHGDTSTYGDAPASRILSRALSLAESNRFSDAKRVLRRLGPVEELSPAAVDLLIRIYTSEDRLDKAELVWRFAKGHGQIEVLG